MFPSTFDYVRADTVDQALSLLGQHDDAKLLAGGHSLIPLLKLRFAQPSVVVDIGRIAELRGVIEDGETVKIGALTTHHALATSEILRRKAPILAEAAGKIGDPQVRNRGTLGGNIAHADPASDLPGVLVALGANVVVRGSEGERHIAASDFFVDLLETDLREGEILTGIELSALESADGSAYEKCEHPASGYAVCGAAAVLRGGKVSLAFNGVTAVPLAATEVGDALAGSALSDAAIAAAIDAHLRVEDPLSDIQASGPYRVQLAKVYGRRALALARDRR